MKKILHWLDQNILLLLTAILMVIIPALPKLPLADLIEGYIVRLRFEDIAVFVTTGIWGIQLIRKKVMLPQGLMTKLILSYLIIGLLSTLSAMFITRTVPLEQHHIFKLYLHYFRRIEYFSLFFIAYSAIRTKRDLKLVLVTAAAALVGVLLYGFGQKYFLWPAFSTMNREFSKGIRLYLTPGSRVMSTFAGHYDYAAYLMMALSFIVTLFWLTKKWSIKLLLALLFAGAYWSLILTASRTSFLGYLAAITIVALLLAKKRGVWRMVGNWFGVVTISLAVMLTMGDLSARFFQVLNNPDLLVHDITQVFPIKREWISDPLAFLSGQVKTLENIKANLNKPITTPPPAAVSTDAYENVATVSDTPPSALPPDITPEEDALRKALEAERAATASASTEGGYSPNALKYGLSIAIRLDALWPRAIAGFKRNPLLGSGYSTLVKEENEEFTQAESTDNDYLRMLGETGALGTLAFLAICVVLMGASYRLFVSSNSSTNQALGLGMVGAVIALLINATYIDIFESSKIAYLLWTLAAIVQKSKELYEKKPTR